MEPLSIATAVAGFADAATLVGKGILLLRTISNADADFCSLLSELESLHVFVQQVSWVVGDLSQPSARGPEPCVKHIESVLGRLLQTVRELEALAKDLVSGREGQLNKKGETKISKVKWLKHKHAATALRQRCRRSREDMNSLLSPVGLLLQSARHAQLTLGVEEIQLAIRRVINQAANRAMQEPTRPAGQLQTAVAPSPKAHHPLVPQTPNATGHHDDRKHDSHRNAAELGVLAVDVSTSRRCGHRCRCRCHTTSQMQTPSWLRSVVGEHLVRYNAVPFFDKRPCDSPRCRAGTEKFIRLRLHFPSWLLRSAIHIAMSWHACGGLGAAMFLGVSRPVSFGLTWAAIRFNHLDGVRRAISIGGILPTDIDDTTGETILALVLNQCTDNPAVVNIFIESWKHHLHKVATRNGLSASEMAQVVLWKYPHLSAEMTRSLERIIDLTSGHSGLSPSLIRDAILGIGPVVLEQALEMEPGGVNALDAYGLPPLHWAVYRNNLAAARLLLQRKAKLELRETSLMQTALHVACRIGLFDLSHLLLRHGADANCVNSRHMNPLHYAIESLKLVRLLLEFGAHPDGSSRLEMAPLHYLFTRRSGTSAGEVVAAIAAAGGDVNLKSHRSLSPFVYSVGFGGTNGVEALMLCGARPDLAGAALEDLVYWVCYGMNMGVLEGLRSEVGRIRVDFDRPGRTPLLGMLRAWTQLQWSSVFAERIAQHHHPRPQLLPPLSYRAICSFSALAIEIREANWSAGLFLKSKRRLLADGSHQALKRWLGSQVLWMQHQPPGFTDRMWDYQRDTAGYPWAVGEAAADASGCLSGTGEHVDPWEREPWAHAGPNDGSVLGLDLLFGEHDTGGADDVGGVPDEPGEEDEDEFFDALNECM